MKKTLTFIIMLLCMNNFIARSQSIENTTWAVYDNTSTFFLYFHFESDTLSYSSDNINYINASTYDDLAAIVLYIVDLPGGGCPATDTGSYGYVIQNDTLFFGIMNEPCATRSAVFTGYHWIAVTTGLNSLNHLPELSIFPNPAKEEITVKSDITAQGLPYNITDAAGRRVLAGKLSGESTLIDINRLREGLYFLEIGKNNRRSVKIIKQ